LNIPKNSFNCYNPAMEIRNGTPADIPLIKKGLMDSWVEHARHVPHLLDEERMRQANVEGYYQDAFANPDRSLVLVAEVEEHFAGFIKGDIEQIPNFFKYFDRTLVLDDVYVFPEYRRQGVARALFKQAEEIARGRGVKRLQGRAYTFNQPVHRLLESLGYTVPHSTWDKVLD
jgi:GNAT superfamily N-acetyltransferase